MKNCLIENEVRSEALMVGEMIRVVKWSLKEGRSSNDAIEGFDVNSCWVYLEPQKVIGNLEWVN